MKLVILISAFSFFTTSFAAEVQTDCPAMSQNREKIIKEVRTQGKKPNQGSHQ